MNSCPTYIPRKDGALRPSFSSLGSSTPWSTLRTLIYRDGDLQTDELQRSRIDLICYIRMGIVTGLVIMTFGIVASVCPTFFFKSNGLTDERIARNKRLLRG